MTENQTATILWDIPIQTDKEIKANRQTMKKLTKYKDLETEIKKTWGMKTTTVPVIIGALGLVKKGTENYIGKIPRNIGITELQKTVLLGTAHIFRRTLSIK